MKFAQTTTFKNQTMAPTRYVVTTKEGLDRKLNRLITNELMKRYPTIFAELENEAKAYISFDQYNPTSKVARGSNGTISKTVKAYTAAKHLQLIDAVENNDAPAKFFGIPHLTLTSKEQE